MNEYLKLVEAAQKKRLKLTNDQIYQIKNMYNDISKDLIARLRVASKGSINERWLNDYRRQFRKDISALNKVLEPQLTGAMEQSATYAAEIQSQMFDMLNVDPTFSNMFTRIPKEALSELVSGGFYKDGKGLSKRIWHNENTANADFDYIIQKGLTEKRSIAEIAKDLSNYVNPNVKSDMAFKKIYPNVGNKKIEYNSFRLAVTSISHSYQLSMQRSCKVNPFVDEIEWHTSNSHRGTCGLCRSRNGKKFKVDELPLDHPNGICYFTPVVEKSMEDIGTELRQWVNGGSNPTLDQWYKDNGGKIEQPKPVEPKPKKVVTLKDKIQMVKDQIKGNNGITTEEHLQSAGKIVLDELIKARSDLKTNLNNAQKTYDAFGWEKLLKEKTDLAKVNRGFAEPQSLGYNSKEEVAKRWQQVQKELDDLMSDPRLSNAKYKLTEANNEYKGSQIKNILELRKKLSEIRPVGNGDLDVKGHLNKSRSPMLNVVSDAYDNYPKEWIEKSIAHGNITPKKVDRGYYSEYDKVIAISGRGDDKSMQTAIHELGHRFEKVFPEILNAEKLFYERRTKGENLQWLGGPYAKSETTRFDNFIEPYMGKDYKGYAYELVSMGFQYAYARPTDLWKDEDYATWIYGMLALY